MADEAQKGTSVEWQLQQVLADAERQIASAEQSTAMYEAAWRAAIRIGECDSFVISLFDPGSATIRAAYAKHYASPIDVAQLPPLHLESPGLGTTSRVINEGRPILFDDFRGAWRTTQRRFAVDDGGDVFPLAPAPAPEDDQFPPSAIMAPLRDGRTPMGVMALYSTTHHAYDDTQLYALARLADALSERLLRARGRAVA